MHVSENNFQLGLDEIARALPYFPSAGLTRAGLLCHRAECEFNLGNQHRGLVAVAEAADLIRAELVSETDGAQAIAYLVVLATAWEDGDDSERAIALLREAVERNEAAGLAPQARCVRYKLAGVLSRQGRRDEAQAALPYPDEVTEKERVDDLLERARIGRRVEDYEETERCVREKHPSRKVLLATVQSELAEAYQACGRMEEARAKAQPAIAVLREAGHPDESHALLTLALAGSPDPDAFARAMEIAATSQALRPVERRRALDAIANRMQKAGLPELSLVS
jgi:tetratricopeptide (TPR) repeat protein